jgi:hypothetical protein
MCLADNTLGLGKMDGWKGKPFIYDGLAGCCKRRGEMAERLNAPDSKLQAFDLFAVTNKSLSTTTARTESVLMLSNVDGPSGLLLMLQRHRSRHTFPPRARMAEMGRPVAIVLYGVAMAALIVGVDLAFFRNLVWGRLIVNIGIVLVFAAFYLKYFKH